MPHLDAVAEIPSTSLPWLERELQHHKADGRGPNCPVYDIAQIKTPL